MNFFANEGPAAFKCGITWSGDVNFVCGVGPIGTSLGHLSVNNNIDLERIYTRLAAIGIPSWGSNPGIKCQFSDSVFVCEIYTH